MTSAAPCGSRPRTPARRLFFRSPSPRPLRPRRSCIQLEPAFVRRGPTPPFRAVGLLANWRGIRSLAGKVSTLHRAAFLYWAALLAASSARIFTPAQRDDYGPLAPRPSGLGLPPSSSGGRLPLPLRSSGAAVFFCHVGTRNPTGTFDTPPSTNSSRPSNPSRTMFFPLTNRGSAAAYNTATAPGLKPLCLLHLARESTRNARPARAL